MKSTKKSLHEDYGLIGDKGFKEERNSFKKSLSYKVPNVTIFDVLNEIRQNKKRKDIEKELGK